MQNQQTTAWVAMGGNGRAVVKRCRLRSICLLLVTINSLKTKLLAG